MVSVLSDGDGGRTPCVLSFCPCDNRPLTPPSSGVALGSRLPPRIGEVISKRTKEIRVSGICFVVIAGMGGGMSDAQTSLQSPLEHLEPGL